MTSHTFGLIRQVAQEGFNLWPNNRVTPSRSGCNVRTQDPENFDEEVKSLVTAWRFLWVNRFLVAVG